MLCVLESLPENVADLAELGVDEGREAGPRRGGADPDPVDLFGLLYGQAFLISYSL